MGRIWRTLAPRTKRRLGLAALASVVAPWCVGELVKTFHQPGLSDDPERAAMFVDILVVAVSVFSLSMVGTVLMGCLITAVLKGPRHFGDPFPDAAKHDHST